MVNLQLIKIQATKDMYLGGVVARHRQETFSKL